MNDKPFKPHAPRTSRRYATAAEATRYTEGYFDCKDMKELPADAAQAYKDGWHDAERELLGL